LVGVARLGGCADAPLHPDPAAIPGRRALGGLGLQVSITADGSVSATLHETGSASIAPFDYPEGTAVGAPAPVTLTGTYEHVPGSPAVAERLVFDTTIDHIGDEGFPVAHVDEPDVNDGQLPAGDPCAALEMTVQLVPLPTTRSTS
jgi:hypothetical protein